MPFKAAPRSCVAMLGMLLIAAGCAATPDAELFTSSTPLVQRPSDEDIALGRKHYAAGDYGLAERHFRAAVESNPQSAGAWLGLAAAYDRLSRFDLAERAYLKTIDLQGKTPAVLNNLGYHYLLRGQLAPARKHLLAAAAMAPNNPQIRGNLRLLETWKTGS